MGAEIIAFLISFNVSFHFRKVKTLILIFEEDLFSSSQFNYKNISYSINVIFEYYFGIEINISILLSI